MSDERPISEAYYAAVSAIAAKNGTTPLPHGLNEATVGNWKLYLNASSECITTRDRTKLQPFELLAENTVYFSLVMLDPYGGIVGGMSEDQFITEMKEAADA